MEQSFLAWLRGRVADLPELAVGIGDDAAILASAGPDRECVVCTDQIVDGVDFLHAEQSLHAIGRKSVLINLSDMAAMAGSPKTLLVTLSLPRERATQLAAGVYEGILEVAQQYELSVSGGDITVYDGPLAISVTLLGEVPAGRRWLRSGAREGDAICVTGALGGSILGRHLEVRPRLSDAWKLAAAIDVHAAIDISDGLSLDLDRLCAASGLGAEFDPDLVPIHEDARRLEAEDGQSAFEHAWGDGEDFELILAIAPADLPQVETLDLEAPITPIGRFTARTGLWARRSGSSHIERKSPRGFLHGRQ
jgi:thiamine-monophosphate kinase